MLICLVSSYFITISLFFAMFGLEGDYRWMSYGFATFVEVNAVFTVSFVNR